MPTSENPDRGMTEMSERFQEAGSELYLPAEKAAESELR
jgi:hypothetical protein